MVVFLDPPPEPVLVIDFAGDKTTVIFVGSHDLVLCKRVAHLKHLSPVDMSSLKAAHGNDFFETLRLANAYRKDGSVARRWSYIVSKANVHDEDRIVDLHKKLFDVFPRSKSCWLYVAYPCPSPGIVARDLVYNDLVSQRKDIERTIAEKYRGVSLQPTQSVITREILTTSLIIADDAKELVGIGIAYKSLANSHIISYPVEPSSDAAKRMNEIQNSPHIVKIDESLRHVRSYRRVGFTMHGILQGFYDEKFYKGFPISEEDVITPQVRTPLTEFRYSDGFLGETVAVRRDSRDPVAEFQAFAPILDEPFVALYPERLFKVYNALGGLSSVLRDRVSEFAHRVPEAGGKYCSFFSSNGFSREVYRDHEIYRTVDKTPVNEIRRLLESLPHDAYLRSSSLTLTMLPNALPRSILEEPVSIDGCKVTIRTDERMRTTRVKVSFDERDGEPRSVSEVLRLYASAFSSLFYNKIEHVEGESKETSKDYLEDYFATTDLPVAEHSEKPNDDEDDDEEEGYLSKSLKRADAGLFDYKADNGRRKYSKACQSLRQPVIMTQEEALKNDEAKKAGKQHGTYGMAVAFGSTAELMSKNVYVCPDVWCPTSRMAMSLAELKLARGRCPAKGEKPMVFSELGPEYWVKKNRVTGKVNAKERHVGFLDPKDHPDSLCMPCCFSKAKDVSQCVSSAQARLGIGSESRNDEITRKGDSGTTETTETEKGYSETREENDFSQSSKYIMSATATLSPGRFGMLPDFLCQLLGNSFESATGFIAENVNVYLRLGRVPTEPRQPLLDALHLTLGFASVAKLSHKLLEAASSLSTFVELSDGNVLVAFKKNVVRKDLEKTRKELGKHRDYVERYSINVNDKMTLIRESCILAAHERFKAFLADPDKKKREEHVSDLLQRIMYKTQNTQLIFFDSDNKTSTTLRDDISAKVVMVMSSSGGMSYDLIVRAHFRAHKPVRQTKFHDPAYIPRILFRPKAEVINKAKESKIIVMSYDHFMVGFVDQSGRRIDLDTPQELPQLQTGQVYEYEGGNRGFADLSIFVQSCREKGDDAHDKSTFSLYRDAELLSLISHLRDPESPLPLNARVRLAEKHANGKLDKAVIEKLVVSSISIESVVEVSRRPNGGYLLNDFDEVLADMVRPFMPNICWQSAK
jgi:hypothetical protein